MKVTVHFTFIKPTREELSPASLTRLSSEHKRLRTDLVHGFITPASELVEGGRFYMLAEPLSRENGEDQREITSSSIRKITRKSKSEYVVETENSKYLIRYEISAQLH